MINRTDASGPTFLQDYVEKDWILTPQKKRENGCSSNVTRLDTSRWMHMNNLGSNTNQEFLQELE